MILLGVEPNYRWRAFNELVVGLARDLGVELVVTLGALLADVPHTRAAPVTGAASDHLARRGARAAALALRGPDGHRRRPARRVPPGRDPVGEPLVGGAALRVARAEPARGARRSATVSASCSGSRSTSSELEEAEEVYAEQITEAVASDPETAAYVEELERRADTIDELIEEEDLPTGESLAAELTRFLRDRESDDDPPRAQ